MKVKDEESEKAGLKQTNKKERKKEKTKIMASGPIISWQINGEIRETVRDFLLSLKSLPTVTAVMRLKDACFLEGKL